MTEALADPAYSKYGFQQGLPAFRQAASRWIERRFGKRFDPVTEILPLIGSKDGLAHLPFAVVNPGDATIVPEPGYQAYLGGSLLAGAEPYVAPLRPEHGFLLELEQVPAGGAAAGQAGVRQLPQQSHGRRRHARSTWSGRSRSAAATASSWRTTTPIAISPSTGIARRASSRFPGAADVALEFFSLSKSFSMTGWRLGFVAGRRGADRRAHPGQVVHRYRAVPRGAEGRRGGARPGRGSRRADPRGAEAAEGRGRAGAAGRRVRAGVAQGGDVPLGRAAGRAAVRRRSRAGRWRRPARWCCPEARSARRARDSSGSRSRWAPTD